MALARTYVLEAPGRCTPEQLQTLLYDAARIIMFEDRWALKVINKKLQGWLDPQAYAQLPPVPTQPPVLKRFPFVEALDSYLLGDQVRRIAYVLPNGNVLPTTGLGRSFMCDQNGENFWPGNSERRVEVSSFYLARVRYFRLSEAQTRGSLTINTWTDCSGETNDGSIYELCQLRCVLGKRQARICQ